MQWTLLMPVLLPWAPEKGGMQKQTAAPILGGLALRSGSFPIARGEELPADSGHFPESVLVLASAMALLTRRVAWRTKAISRSISSTWALDTSAVGRFFKDRIPIPILLGEVVECR